MGFETDYTCTINNEQATVTDAEGHVTAYVYDALSRVASVTPPRVM